jgi:hypothetical protein
VRKAPDYGGENRGPLQRARRCPISRERCDRPFVATVSEEDFRRIIAGLRVLERPGRGPCGDALPVAANLNLGRGMPPDVHVLGGTTRISDRMRRVEDSGRRASRAMPCAARCRISVLISVSFVRVFLMFGVSPQPSANDCGSCANRSVGKFRFRLREMRQGASTVARFRAAGFTGTVHSARLPRWHGKCKDPVEPEQLTLRPRYGPSL